MGSGGGAILARAGTGVQAILSAAIPEDARHRLAITWVDGMLKGGIHMLNVYLRHSEGLSEADMLLLEQAACALGSIRGPWIACSDWNFTPQVLAESGWLKIGGGSDIRH